MENNERKIIDRIKSHRETVDMDLLWDNVAPHIPQKRKKRRFGFLLFGGILIAGLLSFGFLIMPTLLNKEESFANDIKKNQFKEINSNQNSTVSAEKFSLNNNDKKKKTEFINSEENKEYENKEYEIKESAKQFSLRENTLDFNISKVAKFTLEETNSQLLEQDAVISSGERLAEVSTKSIIKNLEQATDKFSLEDRGSLSPLALIGGREIEKLGHETKSIIENLPKPIHVASSDINRWGLYLNGGASMLSRNLMARDIELQAESARRSSTVDVLAGWSVEGGIGYRLTPKLTMLAGLQYLQIHERARFESEILVDLEGEVEGVINRQDGTLENVTGSVSGQGLQKIKEVRYNQLRLIQLPVSLSYQVLRFNKMTLDVGLSAAFGLSQEYKGFTSLSSSQPSYNLAEDEDGKFNTAGTMSYGLQIMGSTHLTSMLDLRVGLAYTKLQNINSEIYLIDQEYNSITLTGGLYRRF